MARIALVTHEVVRHDAISDAVADTWQFLTDGTEWDVTILACHSDRGDVPVTRTDFPQLLLHPGFLGADLVVYHFGLWRPVYDAMLLGCGRVRQAVVFHNVTPAELAPQDRWDIDRSFVQINNFRCADRLWPVSRTNAELLEALGFDPAVIDVIPLAVGRPPLTRLAEKPPGPVELVFVGRIVPHKGVRDLIEAIARIRGRDLPDFRLRVLGNLRNSDRVYARSVRQAIADSDLAGVIEFPGTVDDATRDRILQSAHILAIPSYHEGFCKPVIEGLRAGCIPVGYAAYNLRYIADGLCRMVAPGDIGALAEALAAAIADAHAAIADPARHLRLDRGGLTAAEFAQAARAHVDQFAPKRVAELTRRQVAQLLASPPRSRSWIGSAWAVRAAGHSSREGELAE